MDITLLQVGLGKSDCGNGGSTTSRLFIKPHGKEQMIAIREFNLSSI